MKRLGRDACGHDRQAMHDCLKHLALHAGTGTKWGNHQPDSVVQPVQLLVGHVAVKHIRGLVLGLQQSPDIIVLIGPYDVELCFDPESLQTGQDGRKPPAQSV
eukprot:scaffold118418_cov45-Prasinocladus_malaysianus.AAC.1